MRGWLLLVLASCGGSGSDDGELGGHCYPNGTCNVTLTCSGGVCVAEPEDAAVKTDAAIDSPVAHDAAIDAPVDAVPDAAPLACVARMVPANAAHIHSAGATSHAGENCVQGGCHLASNTGTNAPGFQFGGTLYGPDGATPNRGATIRFKTNDGTIATTTSDEVGNFYLESGSLQMAFPAQVQASVCATGSTTTPAATMTAPLQNGDGACARAGCHTPGAGQGAIKLAPVD